MIKNQLKSLARRFLHKSSREAIRRWGYQSLGFLYWGHRVHCPICQGHFRRFRTFAEDRFYQNLMCPWCLSLERHRLLWLYFQQQTDILKKNISLLHVAPEYSMAKKFLASPNIHYAPVGLNAPYIQVEMNLLQIAFQSDRFDVIICFHILDQIPDDLSAMRELRRVLKPGGLAFIQSPIDYNRETTFEDPTCVTPEARARLFGQKDHIRIYGRDFKDRLAAGGFSVRLDNFVKTLPPETIERYGLIEEDCLYICTK